MSHLFPLSTIRHSASHILAQAVQCFYPNVKLGIGPSIDDGFYYDFDLDHTFNEDDLEKIEKKMLDIIAEKQVFLLSQKTKDEAFSCLKEHDEDYKLDLVETLGEDSYSFYTNGPFVDLCKGPHVDDTSQIPVIKLLRVSGAYWRGDEKNKMLQRIYGTAFYTQQDLDGYLHQLEEAQKRDHRVLGKQLDLFSIQDAVGPGLVLWHPKGSRIRDIIESYWKQAHYKSGYELLHSPHIGRESLWQTSGHVDFYKENMFSSIDVDNNSYHVRPMNCPFHIMIYKTKRWSYRDLPLRLAELGTVYRYERSGVLHGLFRVRGFTQDDAHIFCSKDAAADEIKRVMTLCFDVLKAFGFESYDIFLSTRPEDKYVGDLSHWTQAEDALKHALEDMNLSYELDEGGGAFYGPKIDIKIKDAIGRQWQCSTIQFDFNLPERFDLSYVGSDGELHRPFMIHRALLGSIERFFGILIEQYEGKFPVWLAPTQLKLLPIHESSHEYCQDLISSFRLANIRVEIDTRSEKLGYKIRQAQQEKVPYMGIIGKKEMAEGMISIRSRDHGDLGLFSLDDFVKRLVQEDREKTVV